MCNKDCRYDFFGIYYSVGYMNNHSDENEKTDETQS